MLASAIAGGGTATATGISIHVSTFDGSIVNSGGTITALASGVAAFARGLGLFDGTYLGGVTNAGAIVASATATGSGFGSTASATGILICGCVGPFSNGIVNSGSILSRAQGTTASAVGMSLNSTTFLGGVTNSGTITAVANGSGTARAIGIGIGVENVVSTFAGGVTNAGGIFVSATAGTSAAIAVGIGVRASTFSGDIANTGTIAVMANGTRATVTGIGAAVLSFGGSIVNNGTIAAVASDFGGQAGAVGIGVYGTTSAISLDPFGFESSVASSFSGSIVNNGTIVAMGTGFLAGANGIYVNASTLTGGITNNGSITAVANGTFAVVATGINLGADTFAGDVVNNGAIVVAVDPAAAPASGFGINIHGTFGTLSTASFFGGSVVNMGSIAVVATADSAPAKATGISIAVSTFAGSVVNHGSVSAIASGTTAIAAGLALFEGSYIGGINNSGSIVASATATAGPGVATATGILLFGCVGPFSGGVVNSGAIVATAQGRNAAKALGTSLNSTTFSGGFANNGTISAAASARHTAVAVGIGIGLEGPISLFSGGIINTGAVSASATATATAVNGFATATGIAVFASSLAGNINNSGGTIVAVAQANGTAAAFGLRVATDTAFSGNIINSGTIAATANQGTALGIVATSFAGTIVNSGTITGTVIGVGTGVGIGLVSSAGTIANTGTIEGNTWAINLAHAGGSNTINQNAGSIIGPTSGSGGAILFSGAGDTLNINGGSIIGDIAGSGGTAPTVNVQPGAGNIFSYADSMSGIGTMNLKSGTLLLQNLTTAGANTANYNQSAGTTLALEISPEATLNHASLSASGAITLAPGAVLQAFAGPFAWKPGNYTYDALITGGTINGTFVVTSNSPFFVANLSQNGNVSLGCGCVLSEASTGSLSLSVTMLSPSQVPGLTANQISVANAIINIPDGNATLDQLFTLSNPGPALSQLSAEQFTQTNYQPLVQAWQTFSAPLSDRLSQGGGYGGSATASYDPSHGLQFAQANVRQVAQISDADTRTLRAAPPRSPNQWGVWTRGYGLSSTAPSAATSSPYSESGAGLIVGADNQITDRIVAGVALNVSTDKANVTGGGFTQTDAYQGSLYGQYQVDANWYLNGIAGFGWQTYKTKRVVTLLAPGVNNGSFDGQSYQLYGESGYALHPAFLPQTRITPYLGFGYLHVHNNAFTETGSASALSVQAMDPNSFTTTLGARADATFQIGATAFRPELRAAWQHEYLDQSATLRAAFVVAPGSLFTATGTGFGRESFLGGAGVTTTITSSTQLFFDYDAKINGGYTSQAVSGGLRAQF